jgi:septum formation protein
MACGPQPLILASSSPQRRAILEQLGVRFTVQPADVDEYEAGEPRAVAELN